MHIAMSPDMKGFRQDLINSPLNPFSSADSNSEKAFQKKDHPQVLLVEDNPINLKVSISMSTLYTLYIVNSSSY
jgi:hypothetical protein